MIRRVSIIGLVVALVTGMVPAQARAEDHSLAALQTSAGLSNALRVVDVDHAQTPTQPTASKPQLQQQQQQQTSRAFFQTTAGRAAIVAMVAAAVSAAWYTYDKPRMRTTTERPQ